MSPTLTLFVIGLILFFYLMLVFYPRVCKHLATDSSSPNTSQKITGPTSPDDLPNLTKTGKVVFAEIRDFAYRPRNITILPGTTVIWTNQDAEFHSVTSLQGSQLRSNLMKFREQYANTFTKPGKYLYYCTMYPYMMGTVTVLDTV